LATATAAIDEIVTERSGSILRVELNRPLVTGQRGSRLIVNHAATAEARKAA
jgi:hypothetical protein